jgi:hypothetical protein
MQVRGYFGKQSNRAPQIFVANRRKQGNSAKQAETCRGRFNIVASCCEFAWPIVGNESFTTHTPPFMYLTVGTDVAMRRCHIATPKTLELRVIFPRNP